MELIRYDANGPEVPSSVASFEILDPDLAPHTQNTYCIGFKYLRGNPMKPQNWRYDYSVYYNRDHNLHADDAIPIMISKETLDNMLSRHSVKVEDLLSDYINKVYGG